MARPEVGDMAAVMSQKASCEACICWGVPSHKSGCCWGMVEEEKEREEEEPEGPSKLCDEWSDRYPSPPSPSSSVVVVVVGVGEGGLPLPLPVVKAPLPWAAGGQ